MKNKLRLAFEELQGTSINIHEYLGDVHDIAFDLWYTETFIAGIADRILSGDSISSEEIAVIRRPFLLDETFWTTSEGLPADLRDYQKLLELARQIEEVRRICARLHDVA